MNKDKIIPLCTVCLSLAMIISSTIIAGSIKRNGMNVSGLAQSINNVSNTVNNGIINRNNGNATAITNQENNSANQDNMLWLADAAKYLGISSEQLQKIIDDKNSKIPYIKTQSMYIFNKKALDKWLETTQLEIK